MALAIIFESVGFGEWLVLLAVLLVVVGPNRLPSTARKFGQYYSKFRRAAEGFKRQLLEMDTELTQAVQDAEKAVEESTAAVGDALSVDDGPADGPTDYDADYGYDEMYGTGDEPPASEPVAAAEPPAAESPVTAAVAEEPKQERHGDSVA